MCLQRIRCFHQHQLSLGFGAFSLPLLFKDRKIINNAGTNGSTGSGEKGLLRNIKLLLGDRSPEEEYPQQNQFRVWSVTQVSSSSAPDVNISPSTRRRTQNSIYNVYIFSSCLPQTRSHSRKLLNYLFPLTSPEIYPDPFPNYLG